MSWQSESLAAFAALVAVYGVDAQWVDDQGATHTPRVLYVSPTQDILGGMQLSSEYAIEYDPASLPGLRHGHALTVAGTTYTVREIHDSEDGFIKTASLKQ